MQNAHHDTLVELGDVEIQEAHTLNRMEEIKQEDSQNLQAGRLMLLSVYQTLDEDQQMLLNRGMELVTGMPITMMFPRP